MAAETLPEEVRPCRACLKPLPFGQARLMWEPGGTYRLCKRIEGCRTRAKKRLHYLETAMTKAGIHSTDELEYTVHYLRGYVR